MQLLDYNLQVLDRNVSIYTEISGTLGTGGTVWDSGISLAKYFERNSCKYTRILELGSGTGIVGIACAMLNPSAKIILTDQSKLVPLLERNVENFTSNIQVKPLEWGNREHADSILKDGYPDLVIFSDLIAWPEHYHNLVDTLRHCCNKDTVLIFSNEKRNFKIEADFYRLLGKYFTFRDIKPEQQHQDYLCEDIYIFTAKLKT